MLWERVGFQPFGDAERVEGLAAQMALRRWGMQSRRRRKENKQKGGDPQAENALEGGEKINSEAQGQTSRDERT
jgi:hypothetical protein